MSFNQIHSVSQSLFSPSTEKEVKTSPYQSQQNFATFLKQSLNEVSKVEHQSHVMTEKLVKGEDVDLHQVMISAQKASISLQTTVELRNKVVEAYQEVMRMQM
ncbi:flagellar hook-basal body complex protein FliE [Bacillus sp. 2205SS5-2]|uniref:flagellar hook-basal body complex protein FliE n=1 Tax=Bacillus sp. 2205SS5-2 TaxID=3109031 RepID=UPI0030046D32